jgi:hypothetical protein
MRANSRCLLAAFLIALPALPQGTRPMPPGRVQAEKSAEQFRARMDENLPQPVRPGLDPAKLQAEAAELSRLAASLPAQINQVKKGQLPKDLGENLKRIEKLAKHLRSEISP